MGSDGEELGFKPLFDAIVANVERAIQGKGEVIRLTLVALVAEGHVLLEDVPGVGKTMLAKSLARSLGCSWSRIQFTPDLLPTSPTSASRTRSTAPPPRPRAPSSSAWRSVR